MAKPREKVILDCDVRSRDLSFRSVWRELKSQGWTNKRPPSRSLDGRYRYIRPSSSADGAEGVDYFLGENAVLEYYANIPTDHASADSADDESEYEPDDNEGGDSSQTALNNDLLDENDDTLNEVCDGEEAAYFSVMDAGDDAEKDDSDDGEESFEDCIDISAPVEDEEVDPTENDIAAEVLFAESFLDRFGGEDQVLSGNLKNEVLRDMAAVGWEDVEEPDTREYLMGPYEPVDNTQSYPGLRQGYSGPTAEALRNADSPLALFFFFMPVALWQHIAVSSNDYGREMTP
ncbi:hypothetical protein PInf_011113 [Phytophthora infestans]|nr:hypothetical protein PInf_011113 [Phytophthora infestans]